MPINFEPAQPLDMAAAADYGAAQSFQQALPTIAGLYEAGGRLQAGAQAHAASLAAQGAQANAHLSLQHNQFVAAQDHATQRDLFESTHAIEMANQRAQLTDWLNSRALSEHEQRRYDAMDNAVAEVYRNPDLSKEEQQNLVMKLKTGIDAYEERQKRASAKLKLEQDQHLLDLHAKTTRLQDQDNQIQGQSAQQRTSPIQLSDGRVVDATYEGNGKWHYHEKQPAGKAEKPVTRFGDESGTFSYKNALPEAKAEAEAAVPVVPEFGPDGKMTKKDKNVEERTKYMQEVLARLKAEHARTHGPDVGGGDVLLKPSETAVGKNAEAKGEAAVDVFKGADLQPAIRQQGENAVGFLNRVISTYGSTRSQNIPPETAARVKMAEDVLLHIKALTTKPAEPAKSGLRQIGEAVAAGYSGEGS